MVFDTMKKAGIMMTVALLAMTPMAAQNTKLMKSNTQKVMFNGRKLAASTSLRMASPCRVLSNRLNPLSALSSTRAER